MGESSPCGVCGTMICRDCDGQLGAGCVRKPCDCNETPNTPVCDACGGSGGWGVMGSTIEVCARCSGTGRA